MEDINPALPSFLFEPFWIRFCLHLVALFGLTPEGEACSISPVINSFCHSGESRNPEIMPDCTNLDTDFRRYDDFLYKALKGSPWFH